MPRSRLFEAGPQDRRPRIGMMISVLVAVASSWPAANALADERVRAPSVPHSTAMGASEAFKTEVGDRIFFAESSAALGARARVALEQQAEWLKRHSTTLVVVEGYADDAGGQEVNNELARLRAETVRERLIDLGVSAHRVKVSALGQSNRVVICADAACAAPNRRVVMRITGPAPAVAVETDVQAGMINPGIRPALRRLF